MRGPEGKRTRRLPDTCTYPPAGPTQKHTRRDAKGWARVKGDGLSHVCLSTLELVQRAEGEMRLVETLYCSTGLIKMRA